MEIVFNALEKKPVSRAKEYTCEKCGSRIKVLPEETFRGFMGDVYFKCPVCFDNSLAYETEDFEDSSCVNYPRSFYYHTNRRAPEVHECNEAEINGMIQDLIERNAYCTEKSRMDIAQMGDTTIFIVEDDVIDDEGDNPNGLGAYHIYVCRNCDEAIFDKN